MNRSPRVGVLGTEIYLQYVKGEEEAEAEEKEGVAVELAQGQSSIADTDEA